MGEPLSSTEVISESDAFAGSTAQWSFVGNLPGRRKSLRGITLNNEIFMSGRYCINKLLNFGEFIS